MPATNIEPPQPSPVLRRGPEPGRLPPAGHAAAPAAAADAAPARGGDPVTSSASGKPTAATAPAASSAEPSVPLLPPRRRPRLPGHVLLPGALFVLLVAVTCFVWQWQLAEDQAYAVDDVARDAERLANALDLDVHHTLEPLEALRQEAAFEAQAPILRGAWGRYLLLAWADGDGVVRHVVPHDAVLEGKAVGTLPEWAASWERARGLNAPAGATAVVEGHGAVTSVVIPPGARLTAARSSTTAPAATPPPAPGSAGALLVRMRLHGILSDLQADPNGSEFLLELTNGDTRVVAAAPRGGIDDAPDAAPATPASDAPSLPQAEQPVPLLGPDWRLRVTATPAFARGQQHGVPPAWVLIGGLGISALVSGSVFQALRHRARQTDHDREQLQALESLNEIAAGISARLGAGPALLDHCVDAACRLLGMEYSTICLCEDGLDRIRIVASRGFREAITGRVFETSTLPMSRRCLESGEVVAEPDVGDPGVVVNRQVLSGTPVRAMLIIPLKVGGRVTGMLTVGDPRPWRFSDRDLRLAELLGSHVAVIVANGRLYEQMSESVRVRDMLIRQRDDSIRARDESIRQRDESLRARGELMAQREKLAAVTAAVYQAAALDESLKRIVELAPPALGVDVCTVDLIVGAAGSHMVVAAATPPFDKTIGKRFATAGSNAERVVRERRMVVVEDGTRDASLHAEFRELMQVGSVVYIPLFQHDGRPLGMLMLIRHQPGAFSDEQLRLAQVFSTRAAAAIENAQLFQQSRRDAEAKAMLLRELNHRVKNNLAGIVGLLNTTQPADLSPAGRQWLDRVTERINVMGRAHELFVGGPQRVELGALIDQVLPSLSVVRPPGVHVRKDLDGVRVALPTERAVALAMVLHELCYNAIAHGLAGRAEGVVTIRARGAAEPGRVLVEVADDGVGFGSGGRGGNGSAGPRDGGDAAAAASRDGASKGWGLTLVQGLVARELRGRFALRAGDGGGTVAAVEFPVAAEDA